MKKITLFFTVLLLLLTCSISNAKTEEKSSIVLNSREIFIPQVETVEMPTYDEVTIDCTHTFKSFASNNRMEVVYNPNNNLYYVTSGGSSSYATSTIREDGSLVEGTPSSQIDNRGLWYNPLKGQMEAQAYYYSYIYSVTLNDDGLVTSDNTLENITVSGVNGQSCITLDYDNNELIQYNYGTIKRWDRADGTPLSDITLSLPSGSYIASNSIGYTGIANQEYAIYDKTNSRVLLYSKSTHSLAKVVNLNTNMSIWDYGFSYTNGIFFITNSRSDLMGFTYVSNTISGNTEVNVGVTDSIYSSVEDSDTIISWEYKKGEGSWTSVPGNPIAIEQEYDEVDTWSFRLYYYFEGDTVLSNELTVQSKYAQTITFDALSEMAMTDDDQAPVASANSDSTITFTSSNEAMATIVDGKIHPVATGTVTISAIAEENDSYWASETLTQDMTIKAQGQSITFTLQDTAYVGDADITPSATATSSLVVSYSSSDSSIATIVDDKVQMVAEGTCTIYANQAGNGTYAAAPQVSQELLVLVAKPMISDIMPENESVLIKDNIYTASATITTDDPAGIDSAIIVFGTSQECLIDTMSLVVDEDTFATNYQIDSAGIYYAKIVAYGVNGEITSSDTVEINCISLAPVIVSTIPSQDTVYYYGEMAVFAVEATIPEGEISDVLLRGTIEGEPILVGDVPMVEPGLYGFGGPSENMPDFHIQFGVVGNNDTTWSDYFYITTECPEIEATLALEASDITHDSFTARWQSSDDADAYLVDVFKIEECDTIYVHQPEVTTDTFLVLENLDPTTNYYYNVRVGGVSECIGDTSNTISVTTLDISTSPVITKTYPAQDTLFYIGDSLFIGVRATVPVGDIDEAFFIASFDGINPFAAESMECFAPGFYGISGRADGIMEFYIKFAVIANNDTTYSDYYLWSTKCGSVTTTTALEATDINLTDFKAHWSTSLDADSYQINVWKEVDGDSVYVYQNYTVNDTCFVACGLDANTSYYYNIKVLNEASCESEVSNTVSLNTAVATDLEEVGFSTIVTTHPNQISITTKTETDVMIYQISGELMYHVKVYGSEVFDVEKGIYLVKTNDKIHKVLVH